MIPGTATFIRTARTFGGRVIRRLGLLPGGVPDRIGDETSWGERELQGDCIVFFPDTREGLYQLQGWYGPLKVLHEARGVTIVCMDSRTAQSIRKDVDIPVLTISQEAFLDALISRSNVRLFLYVNYTPLNFFALRIRSVVHISLLHGDSDKSVSISNQVKAFDFSFVAGQAAIDRFKQYTALFDAEARCIPIGRPQIDTDPQVVAREQKGPEKGTVLYAPTWEGGHDTVSYGSVPSHGLSIVKSLLSAGFRVIYRPHPLTGQRLARHGEADNEIRRYLSSLSDAEISTSKPLAEDFAEADLLIGDVSSVVNDWLVTGKPIIVTRSSVTQTREAATRLLALAPRLPEKEADQTGAWAREELDRDPKREERLTLAEYYLGDTTRGASIGRFLKACEDAALIRDQEWGRISANEDASIS